MSDTTKSDKATEAKPEYPPWWGYGGGWGWFGGRHPGGDKDKDPEGEKRWEEWQKIMEKSRKENCKCGKMATGAGCTCPGPRGPRGGRGNGPPPPWVMAMMMGMRPWGGPPKDGAGGPPHFGPPGGGMGHHGCPNRDGPPPEVMRMMMESQGQGGGWWAGMKRMCGWGGGPPPHVYAPGGCGHQASGHHGHRHGHGPSHCKKTAPAEEQSDCPYLSF